MAVSAFARSDARYLFVNSDLTYVESETSMILTVSAEFPAYCSAFEANVITPEGMTVTMIEGGADYDITYYNAMGRARTLTPSIATQPGNASHFLVAISQDGYWQDPNGEDPSAWVTYGAVKWEAGLYEEFLLVYVTVDENYHGGNVVMETIPSSGRDTRGDTVNEVGDRQEEFYTDATEPLPDPNPAVTPVPEITITGEEGTVMTVTVTAEEGCTLIVNGEPVDNNTYTYTVERADVYTAGTVSVVAKAVKDGVESEEVTASKDFVVQELPPVAPDAPSITITGEEGTVMTVTVTAEEGCTLIVNGEEIDSNTYSYTVERADIYTAGTVEVTAKAVKDGLESEEATASKDFVVEDQPVADEPGIEFVETKEGDVVTAVEVVVTNYTEYHIWVNGVQLRGEKYYANYNENLNIHVEALNAPGYPYIANDNEADYTLNKLAKKAVADPEISYTMDENNVYVTVTWPELTDGNQVYTGEYTYARPEYNEPDESYNVEAYVEEGTEWLPRGHTTEVIPVPAKDVPKPVITGEEVSGNHEENGQIVPGQGYYEITIDAVDDATVYYRVQNADGTWTDWAEYDDAFALPAVQGDYVVEAKAVVNGHESEVASQEFRITETTAVSELNGEKAVAGVRYFNLAGQEMQEANGMTIVVTTYTDGTTSAVKVMK